MSLHGILDERGGALAQDQVPKVEAFGGYSFNTFGNQDALHGWNASATWNVNRWFGLAADFSGHYGEQPAGPTVPTSVRNRQHAFLFGPRVSRRWERVTLFGHALFGAARTELELTAIPADITDSSFSYALGGGLDLNAGSRVSIRLVQADYLYTRPFGSDRDSFRISSGIVFRLGNR